MELIDVLKWMPWVTIFFIFVIAICDIGINKLLLLLSIALDLLSYVKVYY